MSLKTFFGNIGDFFEGLFNAAKRTWNKLEPAVQNSILHGSGVVEAINRNLDKTPDFIINLIKSKYPSFDLEKLKLGIAEITKGLNIASDIEDPDLETMVANLQVYLKGLSGKTWAIISNSMANIIAVFTAPGGTKVAAIVQLMEFAYQSFVKKKIV